MTAIATTAGVREEHVVVTAPTGSPSPARLSFDNGLERYVLRDGTTDGFLLEARFAAPLPTVWADGHQVHVEYPLGSRVGRRSRTSTVLVDAAVPWALDVHGGAAHLDVHFAGVDVRSVAFHAGAAHVRLRLGRPVVPATIRFTSVSDLRLERPADVPVRLSIARGATKVRLDDRWFGAVGGGLVESTDQGQGPGYELVVAGSASGLTVAGEDS